MTEKSAARAVPKELPRQRQRERVAPGTHSPTARRIRTRSLEILGEREALQKYLLDAGSPEVYTASKGVSINDKAHRGLIIRQMMRWIKVEDVAAAAPSFIVDDPGSTASGSSPEGGRADVHRGWRLRQQPEAGPRCWGSPEASLYRPDCSFISAASFRDGSASLTRSVDLRKSGPSCTYCLGERDSAWVARDPRGHGHWASPYSGIQIPEDGPPPMEGRPGEEMVRPEADLDTDRFAEIAQGRGQPGGDGCNRSLGEARMSDAGPGGGRLDRDLGFC